MKSILLASIASTFAATMCWADSGTGFDAKMDAYMDCWSAFATDVPMVPPGRYFLALNAAVERANKECNDLAREAAKTNGKEAVDDMLRYMQVQFYNANASQQ